MTASRIIGGFTLLFRATLWLYPTDFRRLFSADFGATFADEARQVLDQNGYFSLALYGGHNILVATVGAAAEWNTVLRARFGATAVGRGMSRSMNGGGWVHNVRQDTRYAVRGLLKAPAFSATALLTIAIGVGATTAIFSVVHGVLLEPLPYPDADRLVRIYQQNAPANRWGISVADFQAVEEQQQSFTSVAALRNGTVTLTGRGEPEQIQVAYATSGIFETLGIEPEQGRGFRPDEGEAGTEPVVVLSHALGERHFGPGVDVVGERLTLDGTAYTVIGVMAPSVRTLGGSREKAAWPILKLAPPTRRGPFFLRGLARIRDGATREQAGTDLAQISKRIFPLWAPGFSDERATLTPYDLREVIVGNVGPALLLLFGAVGVVLLIGVANVANLLLVRATGREREMALRTALGATRGRLARQLLIESLILAAVGGGLGVLVAYAGLDAMLALEPNIPRLEDVGMDGTAIAFAVAVTGLSGVLFGMTPLVHGVSTNLAAKLHGGGRAASQGRAWNRLRGTLVTGEFALSLPLLMAAALLLASLVKLQRVDAGFDPTDVTTARVSLSSQSYPEAESVRRFWDEALRRIEETPGVESAAISSALPPDSPGTTNNFDLLDKPVPPGTSQPAVPWPVVTPGFFHTMGIPLLAGRLPDAERAADAPPVVVVSQRWAERFFPGESVVGREMIAGGCLECGPYTVIGVVGNVKYLGLDGDNEGAVYESQTQWTWRTVNLVFRTRGAPGNVIDHVRREIHALDPSIALARVVSMDERLAQSVAQPRYWTTLVGLFAAVGLILAAVGIYGVLSYSVTRQTRDIGVRMALGADRATVRRMVVRRGMRHALLGTAIGLAATVMATRWLESLLFGVSPTDGATLAAVSGVLLLVALAACHGPAYRATRVDPIRALSSE
jgi:putative ABC transport system permease protein